MGDSQKIIKNILNLLIEEKEIEYRDLENIYNTINSSNNYNTDSKSSNVYSSSTSMSNTSKKDVLMGKIANFVMNNFKKSNLSLNKIVDNILRDINSEFNNITEVGSSFNSNNTNNSRIDINSNSSLNSNTNSNNKDSIINNQKLDFIYENEEDLNEFNYLKDLIEGSNLDSNNNINSSIIISSSPFHSPHNIHHK